MEPHFDVVDIQNVIRKIKIERMGVVCFLFCIVFVDLWNNLFMSVLCASTQHF